jgi:outer membrane protein, multidrug efflux system
LAANPDRRSGSQLEITMKIQLLFPFLLIAATLTRAGLPSVGPDYHRPDAPTSAAWRDSDETVPWKAGTPADAFARGEWWKLYSDPVLDDLELRALAANQNLQAAAARVEEARAAAGLARSEYWPQIAAVPLVVREQASTTVPNALI